MGKRRRKVITALFVAVGATCVLAGSAFASPFTAGNFLVYRIGDGVQAATGAIPVFIDEYTPSGGLVQSIPMPTSGATALVSGSSTTEGLMSLSADGSTLVLPGYRKDAAATPTAGPNADTSANTPRVVGRIAMASGAVDTSYQMTDAFHIQNMRSVGSTDGSHFWMGGSASVRYSGVELTPGSSVELNNVNVRAELVFGGNLYESTSAGTRGVREYSGLPTSAATPTQLFTLGGTGNAWQGLIMFDEDATIPDFDTMYTTNLRGTTGFIEKYTKQSDTTWLKTGEATGIERVTYLGGYYDSIAGNAVLFGGTDNTGIAAGIYSLTDSSGFGGTLSGTPAQIVTGVANEGFRGIVVVPAVVMAPTLAVGLSGSDVLVSWPTNATGFSLQSTASLAPPDWQPAGLSSTVDGTNNVVTITSPTGTTFFRLEK